MTASFYSIAKACIWQSKYKTNSTNNNLVKFSYITDNESRIFIQEETNFITNLFTWWSFEFIISFMLSGDDFLSNSGIIRLIWLIKACLCTEYCYIERGNESHLLPDLSYIKDIIYFLLANDRSGAPNEDIVQNHLT